MNWVGYESPRCRNGRDAVAFFVRRLSNLLLAAHSLRLMPRTTFRFAARHDGAVLLLACLLLGSTSCRKSATTATDVESNPETIRAEMLAIAERLESSDNEYVGQESFRSLEANLAIPGLTGSQLLRLQMAMIPELLRLGENQRGYNLTVQLSEVFRSTGVGEPPEMDRFRILANLRLAEQMNCVSGRCEQSCIFPIERRGVHKRPEPAERARAALLEHLANKPTDTLETAWLLNIVNMTLGTYPDEVPPEYRIDPARFKSEYDVGAFVDVSTNVGVKAVNLSGGVVADDFDGDGLIDIFTTTMYPRGPAQLFRNRGDGTFEDVSKPSGIADQLGGLNCIGGDYDNDGDIDLMILRGGWIAGPNGCMRNSLMRNDGDFLFTDVTHHAGLAEPAYPTHSAAWGDFDNDGDLDLYVGHESCGAIGVPEAPQLTYPSKMYRNDGNGTFTDIAESAGVLNNRFAKGVTAGDYDNDGDLDLYVSNFSFSTKDGVDRLYRNNGDWTFTDVAAELGAPGSAKTFATWFFDYDNDGWLDIYVAANGIELKDLAAEYFGKPHHGPPPRLYHNQQGKGFVDRAAEAGLAHAWNPMGCGIGDVDNDGWLDIYLGTGAPPYEWLMPNVLLRNDGGKRFQDVTFSARVGHLQKGHGIAFADFDNDGDQDIFAQLGGAFTGDVFGDALFANPGHGNHFLKVELVGKKSNRFGIGARLAVEFDEPDQVRTVHRSVGSITSFGSLPFRQELGLGQASKIRRLEVYWPTSKTRQEFSDVPLDACVRIVEGEPKLEIVELKAFKLAEPAIETPAL